MFWVLHKEIGSATFLPLLLIFFFFFRAKDYFGMEKEQLSMSERIILYLNTHETLFQGKK